MVRTQVRSSLEPGAGPGPASLAHLKPQELTGDWPVPGGLEGVTGTRPIIYLGGGMVAEAPTEPAGRALNGGCQQRVALARNCKISQQSRLTTSTVCLGARETGEAIKACFPKHCKHRVNSLLGFSPRKSVYLEFRVYTEEEQPGRDSSSGLTAPPAPLACPSRPPAPHARPARAQWP